MHLSFVITNIMIVTFTQISIHIIRANSCLAAEGGLEKNCPGHLWPETDLP